MLRPSDLELTQYRQDFGRRVDKNLGFRVEGLGISEFGLA